MNWKAEGRCQQQPLHHLLDPSHLCWGTEALSKQMQCPGALEEGEPVVGKAGATLGDGRPPLSDLGWRVPEGWALESQSGGGRRPGTEERDRWHSLDPSLDVTSISSSAPPHVQCASTHTVRPWRS